MTTPRPRRRAWPWVLGAVLVIVLVPVGIVVVPILLHSPQGSSNQDPVAEGWPEVVSAAGDDGRQRELRVLPAEPGGDVDTSALEPGQRLVVSGSGYDPGRGVYVAFCKVPDEPGGKPGPCLGGIPDTEEEDPVEEGTVQFAPSNWINDDWAWRLFGARPFDDRDSGTFTAYLEVPRPAGEGVDCRVDECAIYTRNDHTAAADRVQDLAIPIAYAAD